MAANEKREHIVIAINALKKQRDQIEPEALDTLIRALEAIDTRPITEDTGGRRLIEVLREVSLALSSQTDLNAVLSEITRLARWLVPYTTANIALVEGKHLRIAHMAGYPEEIANRLITRERPIETLPLDKMAIDTRRPIFLPDTTQANEWVKLGSTHWHSYISMPIIWHDEVLGLLRLNGEQANQFKEEDLSLLQFLADAAAIALNNAQMYESTAMRARSLEMIGHIGRQTTAILDLDEMLRTAVNIISENFSFYSVAIGLVEGNDVVLHAASLESLRYKEHVIRQPVGPGSIISHVVSSGESILANDVSTNEHYLHVDAVPDTQAQLCVPIRHQNTIIGALDLQSEKLNAFSEADVFTVQTIADQLAIAIQNARLYHALEDHSAGLEQLVTSRTAQSLQQKEEAEAILQSVADAIAITDAEGFILDINPAFVSETGYSIRDIKGKPIQNLLADTEEDSTLDLSAALDSDRPVRGTTVVRRKDGTEYDVGFGFSPIRQLHMGQVRRFVITMRDISALKEVERMKDAFVSNVSHELRTPITSLRLYHDLLNRLPTERHPELIDRLQRETDRLNNIVEDLLHLSRLDQGRLNPKTTDLDLNQLAEEYLRDRAPMAQDLDLSFLLDCQLDMPTIKGDPGLIGQALSILLTNAFHYTPAGGVVIIGTRSEQTARPHRAGVFVQDDGPGIPAKEREQLFDRFFRGKSGTDSGRPGTGLGLSIAAEIMKQHNGCIEVQSDGRAGRGSIFSLWLPIDGKPIDC